MDLKRKDASRLINEIRNIVASGEEDLAKDEIDVTNLMFRLRAALVKVGVTTPVRCDGEGCKNAFIDNCGVCKNEGWVGEKVKVT